jgi:hypothetical protein
MNPLVASVPAAPAEETRGDPLRANRVSLWDTFRGAHVQREMCVCAVCAVVGWRALWLPN